MPRKKKYFSLIELLIVVAIIAILAGMLLPALNKARENGRSAFCLSSLKQFGTAINIYADNNNDLLPHYNSNANNKAWYSAVDGPLTAALGDDNPVNNRGGRCVAGVSFDSTSKTVQTKHKLTCPSLIWQDEVTYWPNGFAPSYGYNGILCSPKVGHPARKRFVAPSRTMVFGESSSVLLAQGFTQSGVGNNAVFRHNKRSNVVFMDGHAAQETRETMPTNKQNIYWYPYNGMHANISGDPIM